VQPGIIWLAAKTGRRILPAALATGRAWHARSWDRFTVPKPFARVCFAVGTPLDIPQDVTREHVTQLAEELRERMALAREQAHARLAT
jgi:lysophospholipid acyltransferase (LPLAT)-like uncharacterized protein